MRALRISRPIFLVVRLLLMECLPNVASCKCETWLTRSPSFQPQLIPRIEHARSEELCRLVRHVLHRKILSTAEVITRCFIGNPARTPQFQSSCKGLGAPAARRTPQERRAMMPE